MKYFEPEETFEPEILNDSRTRAYPRYQRRTHSSCWLCRCESYEWLPKRDMIQIENVNQQLKEIA